jgi:NCAIR mutase (PurE)-related protein
MIMDDPRVFLEKVKSGEMSVESALNELKKKPFEDIGFAKVDHHRHLRQGHCEVVYCAGKTPQQVREITLSMHRRGAKNILLTRVDAATYQAVKDLDNVYHEQARIIVINPQKNTHEGGYIVVATGGTCDIPVAEEAAVTAETMGACVKRLYDVGVAGLHRLLSYFDTLSCAHAIIAVAGMEGALPSVIAGLVDCPVIAVPTSVGYGASFDGLAALLAMLNSCASGVTCVNIDNGFGAGYTAATINRMILKEDEKK